ncbi:MAG: 4-diphosphocytidyl-2C-methyl-D-erythritol kinase [Rhizobiales bacterium NRL2]|nr:MAG: 4-diphosphocytidyl-2C-methyl-D-erythritol kinase [Rhizobiales bacterium NRL2]
MRFGRLPLDEAEGALLAHSVTVDGRRLKKGHRLTRQDIAGLAQAGYPDILAARLEAGDVSEDEAAGRIAEAACGDGAAVNAPFTGRCNIYAEVSGIVCIDPEIVASINSIDESITIATLRPYEAVEKGQMLATVKIIPFAVEAHLLAAATERATGAVRVAPFQARRVGVISTRLPETKASVIDKGVELMRRRLERTGGEVAEAVTIDHHEDAVAEAVAKQAAAGLAPIVIFSASAITDRRDVVPAGIVAAGGGIDHYGMPVDPGNLMLMARIGDAPVIGAPGCARSPKENGFDWVINRLAAGLEVGPGEIMAMGVGGLLVDTGQRGAPREKRASTAPRMPKVAAILLAAGQSRRMGAVNKLLATVAGKPLVRHAWDAIAASKASPVIVVTGHEGERVREALGDAPEAIFVENPDYAEGLSTSLNAGLLAAPEDCEAVVVCLGDMPRVREGLIDRLISAYNPVEGRAICVPTRDGKRGNPVLFDRQFFAEVRDIAGDVGAKHLIGRHEDMVAEVAVDDDAIFLDVDTPEALEKLA